nr:heparinase II/III family protein [Kangiella sp. HZ709]
MTKDSYKAVIRYGKAGLKERAPHDHDDMLSFWLFKGGDDIVLERGCAPYTSDIRLREEYLSSLSHNVIMNNSGTRADFKSGSVFRTVEMGECSLLEQELSSVSLLYKDRDITHQRRFCLTEAGLTIHDSWKAEKGLLFTLYLSPYAESDILNLDNIKKEQSCLIEDYGNKSGTELNKLMLNLKNEGSLDFVIK